MLAWNLFTLLCLFAAGVLALLWLRELELSRFAAAAGGLAFEIAPYRVMQSRGHLLGPISILLPLALWAFERARTTGRTGWWALSIAALASIPLSGQVHLALGAIPFYLALRGLPVAPSGGSGRRRRSGPVAGDSRAAC